MIFQAGTACVRKTITRNKDCYELEEVLWEHNPIPNWETVIKSS